MNDSGLSDPADSAALPVPDPPGGQDKSRASSAVALGAGAAGALLGGFFFFGWMAMGRSQMQWLGHRMKVNTSLGLLLVGVALTLLAWRPERASFPRPSRLPRWLASLAVALAGATLIEYLAGVDLGIDERLMRDFPSPESAQLPGRMSPNAALAIALLGLAIALGPSPKVRRALVGQGLAITVLAICLLAMVGYLYDASVFYRPTQYIRISPYTAAGLGTLAVSVLALRSDLGLARLMVSRGSGGYLTRPLILLAIVAPILFGWLALVGERLGLYNTSTGTSLLVLATLGAFVSVVVVLARSLEQADVRRRQAEIELRRSSALTGALARAATVDEVVAMTIRLGLPALGASSGGLLLVSEDEGGLRMASSHGYNPTLVDQYLSIPATSDLPAGEALRTKKPVFIATPEEYRQRFPNVPPAHTSASQSWAALPVHGGDRVIGVLGVSFRAAQPFGEAERERLAGLAWQCGQALDRALLFDSEKLAREREQRARESAEAANRAKDEFLAMLGHELRNPLAPIMTALQLMKMRGDESHRKERNIIERQLQHMVRLVDDLLDVSRITRGKIELKRQRIDLGGIVTKAVEVASPLFEQRQHRLEVDVPAGISVVGDEHRLTQVLSNLLTNAAKYTEPGGQIAVTAEAVPGTGEVSIRVKDSGIGIAPELLPQVFDLFVQGYRTPERSEGGLGLGLSIVRMLVEMHGGRVSVRSDGPGRGSEFAVALPTGGALEPAAAPVRPSGPAETSALAAAPSAGRKILVVDDNQDAAELLAEALALEGHEVRVAFDGPSALGLTTDFQPEVAFLDIGLPVMDGYDLARRLRAGARGALTLIAITGYGQAADRARSREAGFDRHLVKPIELDEALAIAEDPARRAPRASAELAG